MAQYSGMNAVLYSSQKDLRTMKSNRAAVFAASLRCTDEVNVVSRGTDVGDLGNGWSVSAAEKDGEREGRFPPVRHEHLLRLIGRSHSSPQAQTEEREEKRPLDWDCGSIIFTSSAKRKAESPRAMGRSFIYNRKRNGPVTEPWGTSLRLVASSERTPSIWKGKT